MSLEEQKALSDFLSISTKKQSAAADTEKSLSVSLTLALRERKGQA